MFLMHGSIQRLIRGAAAAVVVASLVVAAPRDALAHERRQVGQYVLVVGWLTEPAFAGVVNGVDVRVNDARSNAPVEGLERTLSVELIAGGGARTLTLPLRARFGQPGAYAADVIPTRAGAYIFRFSGSIGAQQVDERFESGPGRFDDVRPQTEQQFPDAVPAGADLQRELRSIADGVAQTRIIAIAAAALALAALGASLIRRRSG